MIAQAAKDLDAQPGRMADVTAHSRHEDDPHPLASASATRRPASSHDRCAGFFAMPHRASWHFSCSEACGGRHHRAMIADEPDLSKT